MGNDQNLTLTVKADTADASSKLDTLGGSIGRMTAAFTLGSIATRGVEAAWGFLKNTVVDSIASFNESESVVAQMNATLESTGHAAGMSAKQLVDLSQSLQAQTRFSDETILSAENLLLTFTNIGSDVFPQATEAVLNMATALGQDASGSAIQLGKALQDPILGVSALRRVGVNFNESQQETIKTLVETNRTLEAQQYILAELNKEFGGSATAAAKTFGGQMEQLKNQVDDVQEGIGHGLTSVIYNMLTAFKEANVGIGENVDIGKQVFEVFSFVAEAAVNTGVGIMNLARSFVYMSSYVAEAVSSLNGWDEAESKLFDDFRQDVSESMTEASNFALNLKAKNDATALSFNQMTLDSKTYGQAAKQAFQQSAQEAAEATKKIQENAKAIEDTKLKIKDLQESMLGTARDTATAYAEAYVKQEQKVADIKKQLLTETDAEQRAILQSSLAREELALTNAIAIKQGLSTQVTEAQRRASETDFERTVEDISRKFAEDQKAYQKKYAMLQKELADNETKRVKLSEIETKITTTALQETAKRTAQVQQEAQKQVQEAQRVEQAWANAYASMSRGATSTTTPQRIGAGAGLSYHEFGGTVPGLKGSEQLIMAHGGEQVIPAGQSSGGMVGGGVVINVNNPVVRSDSDITQISRQLEELMRPLMNNAKLVYA